MRFTSGVFIAFLSAVLLGYYLFPKRGQWQLLLAASCFFCWYANPRNLLFLGFTTSSAYFLGLWLDKLSRTQQAKKAQKRKKRKILLPVLLFNLGILCVTKYTNFVIFNLNHFLPGDGLPPVDVIAPMGISFYTFQTVGYMIDVYRGRQPAQRNFFKLALFVSFFPQLVQGPISRYGPLSQTLYEPHSFDRKTVSYGIMRILWGYFKKVVVADRLIKAVTILIGSEQNTGAYVLAAMLFYAFQLYCDFTGGIDITIGIAQTMGIRLAENFNLPYFSRNIKEYWNRWHITMSSWFTDYIFYPISVCKPMLRLSKWSRVHLGQAMGKRVTVYLSSFAVWLTTGIWHGAAWNFIVWGLMNWVVIMVSQELKPLYEKFHDKFHLKGKVGYTIFEVVRTILLMSGIRMFDCYRNVPLTFKMLGSMFTHFNLSIFWDGSLMRLGLSAGEYILLAVCLVIILGVSLFQVRWGSIRDALYAKPTPLFYGVMLLLLAIILVFGAYGIGFDSSQFIYSQF